MPATLVMLLIMVCAFRMFPLPQQMGALFSLVTYTKGAAVKKKHVIRLRIMIAPDTLLGPGKADLLQGIKEMGSIAAAGRRMGMSYKRAWYLLDTMNTCFREPLATATKGGKAGGGAQLTSTGLSVLAAFRRMEAAAERAVAKEMTKLAALMK